MVVPLKILLDYHPKNFRESNPLKRTVISLGDQSPEGELFEVKLHAISACLVRE